MGLAFVPIYIYYLGIEAWGLIGFMTILQAWLTLLDMGLTPTLSREMARFQAGAHSAQSIRDLLRSLEVVYGVVAIAVVVTVWITAPWVARNWLRAEHISTATVAQSIGMMGLVLAARMAEQVYRGAIQGLHRQVWLNGAQSVLATLRWAGAAGLLAWVEASIEVFFLWQGVVSLLSVAILVRQTYYWLPPIERAARFDCGALVRIRSFAGGMAATTLLTLLLTQVDKLLLSKLVSLEDFGYYTLAASAAGALYFLISPIVIAISPRLTGLVAQTDEQALRNLYLSASQWLAVILVPAALMIAAFAEPLLYVWTGNHSLSRQVAPLLSLLAIGTLFNGFMHIPYAMQLAHGWTSFSVRTNLIAVMILVPAILWAVPRYGALGAAWVWLLLNASYVLICIHFMHRRLLPEEKWRWYREGVFKPLLAGSIAVWIMCKSIELPQSRVALGFALACIALLLMVVMLLVTSVSRVSIQERIRSYFSKSN